MPSSAGATSKSSSQARVKAVAKSATEPAFGLLPAAMPMFALAKELRRWSDSMLGVAGSSADLSLNLAKTRATEPKQRAAIEKAGSLLRDAREAAGMTTRELGQAIDLDDPVLIEQAERGKAALPVEVILRLAGVLGRHDPSTFAMTLARSYNPQLWQALDDVGIGRLVAQAGREREMANIYRANDAARALSDADFAEVLGFVRTAFDMAVLFRGKSSTARAAARTTGASK